MKSTVSGKEGSGKKRKADDNEREGKGDAATKKSGARRSMKKAKH